MPIEFTAHNIRLDDGTYTKPDIPYPMESLPWFVSAKRVLDTVFPGDKRHLRLADLGCLEGGFAVEFARMGFQVLGLDVRETNIRACHYVKAHTNLPNLEFAQDDVWNIANYGTFDAISWVSSLNWVRISCLSCMPMLGLDSILLISVKYLLLSEEISLILASNSSSNWTRLLSNGGPSTL